MRMALSLSSALRVPYASPCFWKSNGKSCKAATKVSCAPHNHNNNKNPLVGIGIGVVTAWVMGFTALNADATRIEYYATVGEPLCELNYVKSGLGYCDIVEGTGDEAPLGELINVHYTARFGDERVFDSSYKRGRPLTMRIGVGKVIRGLDQGILGGEGVPPMRIGGKRKLRIPPQLAYGPEPAGCFSGDCNIPGNATLLYDINFVGIYSGNRKN
ncbi:photosynthetic NDH subunit of lumenal location 4, chloroplastic [Abrus precatorius]|uniref:peptidylprolyl isomerase n=1 Tax=Abrus precatorius TaxID=3816 RepID=A0A8B8M5R0_ABRPR|nr:photosynthetic NDH subunit of lumenal location 4, chloroplastic [Abrus precatorius]XP_027364003.1 photosynthetic NDH subunit of lumenal location 4, chloroplastic [Abrus precatorius]XP_027364004.1 photosynthetic NDH subunit of lumenal location 4, chloroplastic [Abrus precatorius]XP_027364005.1 photosynthetic NDH subunit of lumenal location 4, chloroplastic [Abrus precatorius]